jgi:hypothetical protein
MWGISVGIVTAGERRGVRLLTASSIWAEFRVFCLFLNNIIHTKFYVTILCRNKSQVFIEYEESYVFYTSSEITSHIKQFIKYYFKMLTA